MSDNTNLPLSSASPSSGRRPQQSPRPTPTGVSRVNKKTRASKAADDGDHADDVNEQVDVLASLPSISRDHLVAGHIFSPTHFNPDTDILASALDLDLNLEDVDAEDLADLFSNQEGGSRTSLPANTVAKVTYDSLPQSIIDKYKPKYLLSPRGVAHIAPSESQEVGYMRPLTTLEHLAVFGKDGLVHQHCILYQTLSKNVRTAENPKHTRSDTEVERLYDCYCAAQTKTGGCQYRFIIARMSGAMLLYEYANAVQKMPMPHSRHNVFPDGADKETGPTGLSVEQKEFCLRNHIKNKRGPQKLRSEMLNNCSLEASIAQRNPKNHKKFDRTIDNFTSKGSLKFFGTTWEQATLTASQLNEIVDVLKSTSTLVGSRDLESVPSSKTGCLMMASQPFKLVWRHVYIHSCTHLEDGKVRIVVMCNHANKIASMASKMFTIFRDQRLMAEIDFVDQKDGCNFGHVGLSDHNKKFWPFGAVFIMDGTENTDNAISVLQPTKQVFQDLQIDLLKVLKSDGANALRSAATSLSLLPNSCNTHKYRRGGTRGGGHVGGQGSVPRYMKVSLKMSNSDIAKVSNYCLHIHATSTQMSNTDDDDNGV